MKLHAKMILVTILMVNTLLAELVSATVNAQSAEGVTNGARLINLAAPVAPDDAEIID